MNGKLKWIIISTMIVVVLLVAGFMLINEMQYHYTIEPIKEYNYFVLEQEGKCGVIDKSGNVIVSPEYIAVQIPNPSKPVFICISSYNEETKDYETVVYNEKKEVILSEFKNVQAIPIDTNIETNPYEKSNLMYKQDGKYGIITIEGKKITKPIYDEISSLNYREGTFIVVENGLSGVINMKGKVIIKNEYDAIISDNYYNQTTNNEQAGFIVSTKTQEGYRYGYINYRGRTILKPEYTELERVTQMPNQKDYYFIAFRNGQAGLLKNRKEVINFEYEDIQYYSVNNIFIVQRNGKQGAITRRRQRNFKTRI